MDRNCGFTGRCFWICDAHWRLLPKAWHCLWTEPLSWRHPAWLAHYWFWAPRDDCVHHRAWTRYNLAPVLWGTWLGNFVEL